MKKCTICKEVKPYNQFYKNKFTKDGYGSQCKSCDTKERRRLTYEKKQYLVNLFGGKCVKCGYNKCLAALEFHHKNPKEKEFTLNIKFSLNRLIKEAQKCELLCANCHREAHDKING